MSPSSTISPLLVLNAHFLPSSHDWREARADDRSPYDLQTYLRQARLAADAGFDILFQADFPGVNRARVRQGPWSPPFDVFQLAAVTAAAVEGITLMPSVSTLHSHPVVTARALASLDRISGGRASLNLVSSFRSGSAIGVRRAIGREDRHAQTAEYVSLLRALWQSWPPEASLPDLDAGQFVRDALIRDVDFTGSFYEQQGPLDIPPLSGAFPPLMMPAGSLAGLRLAARHADLVFAAAPTLAAAKRLRAVLRSEAKAAGRDPSSVRLVLGCYLHTGGLRQKDVVARAAIEALHRALAQDSPALSLDRYTLDDPFPGVFPEDPVETLQRFGARASGLWELAQEHHASLGDFLRRAVRQGEHPTFEGSTSEVAQEMATWIEQGGADGFQLIQGNDFSAVCADLLPVVRSTKAQAA